MVLKSYVCWPTFKSVKAIEEYSVSHGTGFEQYKVMVVLTLEYVTIQMKALQKNYPVVLFIN